MQILRSDASGAMLLAISADSRYVAASDGRSVSVWKLDGLDGKPFVTHPIGTFDCQFLGNRLVFCVPPHGLLTLDLSSGQLSDFVSARLVPIRGASCGRGERSEQEFPHLLG